MLICQLQESLAEYDGGHARIRTVGACYSHTRQKSILHYWHIRPHPEKLPCGIQFFSVCLGKFFWLHLWKELRKLRRASQNTFCIQPCHNPRSCEPRTQKDHHKDSEHSKNYHCPYKYPDHHINHFKEPPNPLS